MEGVSELEKWFADKVSSVESEEQFYQLLVPILDRLAQDGVAIDNEGIERFLNVVRDYRSVRKFSELSNISQLLVDALNISKSSSATHLLEKLHRILFEAPRTTHPTLLLPLRLETRFNEKDRKLRVRIYPDQIFIDTHQEALSRDEYEEALKYHNAPLNKKRDAWRKLSKQFGPKRAAWLETWVKRHRVEGEAPPFRDEVGTSAPMMRALPDRFHIIAYREGEIVQRKTTNPVKDDRSVFAAPDSFVSEGIFDSRSKWMVDFDSAVRDGFAVEICLRDIDIERGFDRVIAVGIQWRNPSDSAKLLVKLLDSHRFTSGFSFLSPGTPTNNTEDTPSTFSSREEHDLDYESVIEGPSNWEIRGHEDKPRTNAHRLARALGIDADNLRYISGAGNTGDSYAEEVNTITWPVTGEYYLRHLLPDLLNERQRKHIADHQKCFVRGSGPLPTIRVGRQPYGVLPVTQVSSRDGWLPWDGDAAHDYELDHELHSVVRQFHDRWKNYAMNRDRVPRVIPNDRDPDATLLRILSMEPHSVSFRARPYVDERFIAWLLVELKDKAFGEGTPYENQGLTPVQWVKRWAHTWGITQDQISYLLSALTSSAPSVFRDKPLLKILAWFEGRDNPVGISEDKNHPDLHPLKYLSDLCDNSETVAEILVSDITKRALKYTEHEGDESEVKKAVCRLSAQNVKDQPDIDRLFRESLDFATHRIDAWVTSFAWKRLIGMRAQESSAVGLHIGAYGFVEDLRPRNSKPTSEGYLHAPTVGQAATAAVLYNAFLTHDPDETSDLDEERVNNPFRINLTSTRVRQALHLLEGIRQGQPLGALLGYQFERGLKDRDLTLAQHIDELRDKFPIVANKIFETVDGKPAHSVAASNVVDGTALIRDYRKYKNEEESEVGGFIKKISDEHCNFILEILEMLESTLDSVGDLLTTESVYQAVQGNYERSAAAMESASGNQAPVEIESVTTPVPGRSITHRVCLLFNHDDMSEIDEQTKLEDPRGVAEPRVTHWISTILGPLEEIGVEFSFGELGTDGVDLNAASQQELEELPGLTPIIAKRVIARRPFSKIDDLESIDGINNEMMEALRPKVVANLKNISAKELDVNPADFFYIAQSSPDAGETELEQRIARLARKTYGLTADHRIEIYVQRRGRFERSLADAAELAQQAMRLLGSGQVMSPSMMCHPGSDRDLDYSMLDVDNLRARVEMVQRWFQNSIDEFNKLIEYSKVTIHFAGEEGATLPGNTQLRHKPTGTLWSIGNPITLDANGKGSVLASTALKRVPLSIVASDEWSVEKSIDGLKTIYTIGSSLPNEPLTVIDLLMAAAKFGVPGALPTSNDDPFLAERFDNTFTELVKRLAASQKLILDLGAKISTAKQIQILVKAMKALFGKNYIVLPTFVPAHASDLASAFKQDVLNGLGEERLRLWMQQVAEVRQPVADLEDTMMFSDAWIQSEGDASIQSPFGFKLAQLPYTAGRGWVGLSDEEKNEEEPTADWVQSPLSLFVASNAPIPNFGDNGGDGSRTVTAGLLVDEWNELIPDKEVDTSIAFQYDSPGAQAPQSLLLAVPGQIKKSSDLWMPDMLADIVNDTIDLAKVRAVDLDALAEDKNVPFDEQEPIGGIMPGIYLPTDPEQPGWAREVAMKTLDEWINTLTDSPGPCADLSGFIAGDGLGPKFDSLGMVLSSLGDGPPLSNTAGGIVFPPEGIRLSWSLEMHGELLINIRQISGRISEPVPSINAYNSDGDIVKTGFNSLGMSKEFRIDLDQAERIEIKGGYDSMTLNYIYRLVSMCVRDFPARSPVVKGATFGGFVVQEISLQGAASGEYTFRQYDHADGVVHLLRDGIEVESLNYDWQTTISATVPYRFSFPGYFDIDIGKVGGGTQNLYGLKSSLFDGQRTLRVTPP